ncbi:MULTISPECIES: hypothetical protein [unclassified Rhizobium]|uniref:hypothetical protein n=1 Tax=unclassified Rhizobium TaxID=2613769 RepID=UPI003FA7B7C5
MFVNDKRFSGIVRPDSGYRIELEFDYDDSDRSGSIADPAGQKQTRPAAYGSSAVIFRRAVFQRLGKIGAEAEVLANETIFGPRIRRGNDKSLLIDEIDDIGAGFPRQETKLFIKPPGSVRRGARERLAKITIFAKHDWKKPKSRELTVKQANVLDREPVRLRIQPPKRILTRKQKGRTPNGRSSGQTGHHQQHNSLQT